MKQIPNFSFWEKDTFHITYDVIIVGAGIVGTSSAISLLTQEPALKVLLVDRWHYPMGASTRNAGFATFGSVSELAADISERGWETAVNLVSDRYRGLQLLQERVGSACQFKMVGGAEVFRNSDEESFQSCMEILPELNQQLEIITGSAKTFKLASDRISEFGFGSVSHLIFNTHEGSLHPGQMMKSLHAKAKELGAEFLMPFEIVRWERENNSVKVFNHKENVLCTEKLVFATNGFTSQLLPDLEIVPARNQVFLTKPIPDLHWNACFHYREGYYYFRNYEGRVLVGGARNTDSHNEETDEFGITDQIQKELENFTREVILPGIDFEIDYRWSGIMGVGTRKTPIVREIDKHIYCAVRLGGMGVAIGSGVGEQLKDLILGK